MQYYYTINIYSSIFKYSSLVYKVPLNFLTIIRSNTEMVEEYHQEQNGFLAKLEFKYR